MEETIINDAKRGDDTAFGQLAQSYRDTVLKTIGYFIRDPIDAQDVLQETCVEAFTHLEALQDDAKFGAWLNGIARNRCRMWLRKHTHRISIEETFQDGHFEFQLDETVPTPEHLWQPDRSLEQGEIRQDIIDALNTLSPKNREVTTLHYVKDKTYDEISNILNIPISTIEGRLYRARQQLKEAMGMATTKEITKLEATLEDMQKEFKSLKHQVGQIAREEDHGLQSELRAAAERICRLPVSQQKDPLVWGIAGAFNVYNGERSTQTSRRISFNTTDIDEYLSKVSDTEIADFASLFTNPITITILKALMRGKLSVEDLAKKCDLSIDQLNEALAPVIESRLVAREDDIITTKGCADSITNLLTLINLTCGYHGRWDKKNQ